MPSTGRASFFCLHFLFPLILVAQQTHAAIAPLNLQSPKVEALPEMSVRVRLNVVEGPFSITGVDLRYVGMLQAPISGGYQAIRVRPGTRVADFVEWIIEDRDRGTLLARIKARSFEVSGKNLRLNLKPIPGRLTLLPQDRNKKGLQVIANIDLEAYVRGVLPAEMPKGWPLEALKAQAIAARTFALYRKATKQDAQAFNRLPAYDLESTVMDQMYMVPEEAAERQLGLENVERAVRETQGMVLLSMSERPLPLAAYFHADCGGRTEDARRVWGAPGAGTAIDGACPLNPRATWQLSISLKEITQRLRSAIRKPAPIEIYEIGLLERNSSERVSELKLKWSDGDTSVISSHDFRMAIGHEKIKSTNFEITRVVEKNKSVVFSGKGFGHGVGLCQWGARRLAQGGADYRRILNHYYPQSSIALTTALHLGQKSAPIAFNP